MELEIEDVEIVFDKDGRMKYNPSFHTNHSKPFSTADLIYLCKYYKSDGAKTMSFALGRTEKTIMGTICALKKVNMYEHYKNISDEAWIKLEKVSEC